MTCGSESIRPRDLQILIMKIFYVLLHTDCRNEKPSLNHGRPNFLWERATHVISWLAGAQVEK